MLWAISRVAAPDFAALRERNLQPHIHYLKSQMRKGQWNPEAAEGA